MKLLLRAILITLCTFTFASAQETESPSDLNKFMGDANKEIDNYSLEELLNVEITSVSKKKESYMDIASSIYILNEADIERYHATRLMDLLGLVPGVQIQEKNYNQCIYSVRESVKEDTQSVLFLIDGVSSNSYYTGVLQFNLFDLPIQQIERIEVIKGPGGTIYGANANTGIISIYTKKPRDTQGALISMEGGSLYYASPFFRYGLKLSDNIYASIYSKCLTTEGYPKNEMFEGSTVKDPETGLTSPNNYPDDDTDGMRAASGGINLQWAISNKIESLTMCKYSYTESDVYAQYVKHILALNTADTFVMKEWGQDVVISERIDYKFSNDHNLFLNTYFKNNKQKTNHGGGILTGVTVYEMEVQDNIVLFEFNSLSWGGNVRLVKYDAHNPGITHDVNYEDPKAFEKLYAGFIQDKVSAGKYIDIILGAKAEIWTLVSDKPEYSPSARLAVKPRDDLTFWGGVSRSITTPSYIQTNGELRLADLSNVPAGLDPRFPAGTPSNFYLSVVRNKDVKPTEYRTYELGTRTGIIPMTLIDLSGFLAEYTNGIHTGESGGTLEQSYVNSGQFNYQILYDNSTKGRIWGGEAVTKFSPVKYIRTEVSYSFLNHKDEYMSGKKYTDISMTSTSKHIYRLRQYLDLPEWGLFLTINLEYISEFKRGMKYNYYYQMTTDENLAGIPGIYTDPPDDEWKLDITIEKRFLDQKLKIFAWGRNLLADPHVESYTSLTVIYPQTIERFYGGGASYEL